MKVTRRKFLQTSSSATAGLTFAFYLPDIALTSEQKVFQPNAYIRITADNTVTLWVTRSEMGQGVRTTLPAVLAEELEVDLAKVVLEQAVPGARFRGISLETSGSDSSSSTFLALRKAGAAAREMLIAAAGQKWAVLPSSCRAQRGKVKHLPSGRELSYGELVEVAAKLPIPNNPSLKDPNDFKLIGKSLKRRDGPAIVSGRSIYGFDIRVPGMVFATMKRCPHLGGKLVSFDASNALAIQGVRQAIPIQAGLATGVAIVADNTWAALKGCEALNVIWDPGPNRDFDSDRFIAKMTESLSDDGYPVRHEGNFREALANSSRSLEAVYVFPFQAHAPLEPMNCTADVRRDSCEVWVPTQTPGDAFADVQKMLNLPAEAVKIHTTLSGGGFGRRLFVDYVHEAVSLSQAIKTPVQLVWTRTDDMRYGFFQPASVERLSATLQGNNIAAWAHKSVGGGDLTMYGIPTDEEKRDLQRYARNGLPWGAFDNPYSFPAMKVDYIFANSPVPTGPWRAVMYPSRVFARESFVDEIAHAVGKDPLQLRIDLLRPGKAIKLGEHLIDRGRMIRVLELMREKSGWTKPVARVSRNRLWGRGLALNIYHGNSYLAQMAEVSVAPNLSDIRVQRIVCVVDCGLVINPAGLEGQVESGITWGLSCTLHGKIDFRNGGAQQGTYNDFRVMRMNEMPLIETYIVPSVAPPSGFGEHPVPPVAPAVANAVFAATGKRIRRLPIRAGNPASQA